MTPTNEWIVVFYKQTGATRLLPSVDLVNLHVAPSAVADVVFKSPLDFQRQFDHHQLEDMWKKVFHHPRGIGWPNTAIGPLPTEEESSPPNCDTETLTKQLWELLQRVGDRIERVVPVQVKPKALYEIFPDRIDELTKSSTYNEEYPRQCRVIIDALRRLSNTRPMEDELRDMMRTLIVTGKLKTKQDPWLILQFYRKKLLDARLISRGGYEPDSDGEESADQELQTSAIN